jgi:hypothetical protein
MEQGVPEPKELQVPKMKARPSCRRSRLAFLAPEEKECFDPVSAQPLGHGEADAMGAAESTV